MGDDRPVHRLVVTSLALSACGFELTLAPPESTVDAAVVGDANDTDAMRDGAADAAAMQTWTLVDTLIVPANGAPVFSSVQLEGGVSYRLRASGTFIIQSLQGTTSDAEFWDFDNPSGPQEGVVGVDIGLGIDDMTVDENRTPKWGAYNASHTYEVMYTGQGRSLRANVHDGNPTNNTGSLTLQVFALQ